MTASTTASSSSIDPNPLQFLFLGTGTSTGLPLTPCLTLSHSYPEAFTSHVPPPAIPNGRSAPGYYDPKGPWPKNIQCVCCRSAVDPDVEEGWKNKRGNTSAVVRKRDAGGKWRNILVDCGKTFTEQARRWFPQWGVQTIDAVLLTHGHADAYFGLDDLREWCIRQRTAIPIYLNRPTYEIVASSFPYLVDSTQASGGGDVPTLIWNIIDDLSSFSIFDIEVNSYPVHHGIYFTDPPHLKAETGASAPATLPPKRLEKHPLICLAFEFDNKVLYMADVSEVPSHTLDALAGRVRIPRAKGHRSKRGNDRRGSKGSNGDSQVSSSTSEELNGHTKPPARVLVIDALWPLRSHASHFSLAQALETALALKPSITYTVGSTHPTSHFMWEEVCRSLNRRPTVVAGGEPGGGYRGEIDGLRPNHPDGDIARGLVEKVRADKQFAGEDGIMARWARWGGGRCEPGWDGLVLEIDDKRSKEVQPGGL